MQPQPQAFQFTFLLTPKLEKHKIERKVTICINSCFLLWIVRWFYWNAQLEMFLFAKVSRFTVLPTNLAYYLIFTVVTVNQCTIERYKLKSASSIRIWVEIKKNDFKTLNQSIHYEWSVQYTFVRWFHVGNSLNDRKKVFNEIWIKNVKPNCKYISISISSCTNLRPLTPAIKESSYFIFL